MTASVDMVGLKDALRTLNETDKKLRREITGNFREIVDPLVRDAKELVPKKAPLSGFDRSWTPKGSEYQVLPFSSSKVQRPPKGPGYQWQQTRAGRRRKANWLQWQAKMNAFVSGKRPRMSNGYMKNLATLGVRWLGPSSVLFDTTAVPHTPQGQRMVNALNSRFGKPSRVMWRAMERNDQEIQEKVAVFANKVIRDANESLKKRARLKRALGQ